MTESSTRVPGPAAAPAPVTLSQLARNVSFEVMPFAKTEGLVLEHVPTEVPLSITVTEAKGLEPTLALTERLTQQGYRATPHLAARLFTGDQQVAEVADRLTEAGVSSIFVIGGDAPEPAGEFTDARGLLDSLERQGRRFETVSIGGYPEGHAKIDDATLSEALRTKAPHANGLITQACFDAKVLGAWAADVARDGISLPIKVGLPGPVNRQKLIRISAGLGLGQSARFLAKQQNMVWRFLLPGAYDPMKLVKKLGAVTARTPTHISGLHLFTFNEVAGAERWRQRLLTATREGH